ncbi:hypothetical protein JCM10213_007858 [Rhodosporidiobolus nylandii]
MAALALTQLPQLPSATTASAPAPPPTRSSKRRLSTTSRFSVDEEDEEDEEHEEHALPSRSKRRGAGGAGTGAVQVGGPAASPKQQQPGKALTEKEKEQRRIARMIRNRNAAQASRDRKKEHTAFLERRCAELEAQLRAAGSFPSSTGSTASSRVTSAAAARKQREASVVSSAGSAASSSGLQDRIADLEDENDALRSQLHAEQADKQHLMARLSSVEDKLSRLAHLLPPGEIDEDMDDAVASPPAPFFAALRDGTSTPPYLFGRGGQPTFAYDTVNLSPLPQPEERAYLEERERQRRRVAEAVSIIGAVDDVSVPSFSHSVSSASSSASSFGGPRTPSPVTVPALLPPFPIDDHLSSTPPAAPESYLELEPVDVDDVWTQWAKGGLPHHGAPKSAGLGEDESALAFLDLSFLHDAPMTVQC